MTREPMPEERDAGSQPVTSQGRFRERVAAVIALLVILAALALMVLAFRYIEDEDRFGRAKDLLLIINPVLGVVIGYYFNKVSTEARAEGAENVARSAMTEARRATDARAQAEQRAHETGRRLDDLRQAAEGVVAVQPPGPRAASPGGGERGSPMEFALRQLEAALARVRADRAE